MAERIVAVAEHRHDIYDGAVQRRFTRLVARDYLLDDSVLVGIPYFFRSRSSSGVRSSPWVGRISSTGMELTGSIFLHLAWSKPTRTPLNTLSIYYIGTLLVGIGNASSFFHPGIGNIV